MGFFDNGNKYEREIGKATERWKVNRIADNARRDFKQDKIKRGDYDRAVRAARSWKQPAKAPSSWGF